MMIVSSMIGIELQQTLATIGMTDETLTKTKLAGAALVDRVAAVVEVWAMTAIDLMILKGGKQGPALTDGIAGDPKMMRKTRLINQAMTVIGMLGRVILLLSRLLRHFLVVRIPHMSILALHLDEHHLVSQRLAVTLTPSGAARRALPEQMITTGVLLEDSRVLHLRTTVLNEIRMLATSSASLIQTIVRGPLKCQANRSPPASQRTEDHEVGRPSAPAVLKHGPRVVISLLR
jgi:hypothetical protein